MSNKHVYSIIAACTLAAAILFSAFTPSNNGQNEVKTPTKTVVQTDPNTVDCSCTFTSGGCADCSCVGGFATGCISNASMREGGKTPAFNISMSDNQLRQALKYQRLLLSLDSPDAIAAASQVSQLIEAIKDGKTDVYQQVAEQYSHTQVSLPKEEKELVDTWLDNKKKRLEKIPDDKTSDKAGHN
jgi:hypothetical protein